MIDQEVKHQPKEDRTHCGKQDFRCCAEPFDLHLIEVIYLHSKMNRHFTSKQREILIKRAVETQKKENRSCPFNEGSGCEAYEIRPARCRIYGAVKFSEDKHEIQNMLFELSQTVFLAFSGKFQPDIDFTFSVADTISGKFVQKCFHFMSDIENTTRNA